MRREPGAHTGSLDSLKRPVWSLWMTGLQGQGGGGQVHSKVQRADHVMTGYFLWPPGGLISRLQAGQPVVFSSSPAPEQTLDIPFLSRLHQTYSTTSFLLRPGSTPVYAKGWHVRGHP